MSTSENHEGLFARILSPAEGLPLPSGEQPWTFLNDPEPRRWADGGDGDGGGGGPAGDPVGHYDNIDDMDDDDNPDDPDDIGTPDDAEDIDAAKGADDVADEGKDVGDDIKSIF